MKKKPSAVPLMKRPINFNDFLPTFAGVNEEMNQIFFRFSNDFFFLETLKTPSVIPI